MTSNAHELGATVGAWNALVRRARMADRQKLAALVLSSYADANGTNIRCGVARLAVDLGTSYRTAQRYLGWLRQVGLIELTTAGNRRLRRSDVYRLIFGPDVLEHLQVLDPSAYDDARDGLREAREARSIRPDQTTPKSVVQSAPNATDQASPRVSSEVADQASPRVSYKTLDQTTPKSVPPPSNKITSPKNFTSPADDGDLRTAVTGPRATEAELPNRCPDHLLRLQPRTDGLNPCPLCRAGAPPAPDKDSLAPVISLDSRRPA